MKVKYDGINGNTQGDTKEAKPAKKAAKTERLPDIRKLRSGIKAIIWDNFSNCPRIKTIPIPISNIPLIISTVLK